MNSSENGRESNKNPRRLLGQQGQPTARIQGDQ